MASSIFRPSRVIAVALAIGAGLWVTSGLLFSEEEGGEAALSTAATANEDSSAAGDSASSEEVVIPVQRVGVAEALAIHRNREITLSCVTEAENRAVAVARGAGTLIELNVSRGDRVAAGDVIAVVSDEGRQASVSQAQALLQQRMAEYEANRTLIERGDAPRNRLPALEASVAAAKAAVALAEAEADRSLVKAPIGGIVDDVPAQLGQAVQVGLEVAEIVDPDPMLAVGAVSEKRRNTIRPGQGAQVRFIGGPDADAEVNFVGLSADKATRTYPVEAIIENADGAIADGVTCEMNIMLPAVEAVAIPRSSLVFSDDGILGVRAADEDDRVQFFPVSIVDDGREDVWVSGIEGTVRVIVVGQDFVKAGDTVEAVAVEDEVAEGEEPPA